MMEEEKEKKHTNRYKSLLVIQYLLKHADDENPVPIDQIQAHLSKYGIEAERKGIYSDIADFVDLLNTEQDDDNEIAEHDKLKYAIRYTRKPYPTSKKGGYLVTSRPYSFDELKLLTECVNSARFLSEAQAKNLRRTISKLQCPTGKAVEHRQCRGQSLQDSQSDCYEIPYHHQSGNSAWQSDFFQVSFLLFQ